MAISEKRLREVMNECGFDCDLESNLYKGSLAIRELITEIRRQKKVIAKQNRMIKYLTEKYNEVINITKEADKRMLERISK